MWTDIRDAGDVDDVDQADRATIRAAAARAAASERAEAARRRRVADGEIRGRELCRHGGYSGVDPVSGVTLCAICRQAERAGRFR